MMDEQEQLVFAALADPTRRLLIEKLAAADTLTPTALAEGLPMSRQAVSKHLQILEAAGLVQHRQVGRETLYSLTPQPLAEAAFWVAAVTEKWQRRLQALYKYLAGEAEQAPAEEE